MPRRIYLEDVPLAEAWQRLETALEVAGRWQPLEAETLPLDKALGRVTAAPVFASARSTASRSPRACT